VVAVVDAAGAGDADVPGRSENASEVQVMKIAVASQGAELNSLVDPRFGRAACFVIVDVDTHKEGFSVVENTQDAVQGAGVQAAQIVVDQGAEAVLTGNCGPKAHAVFRAAGVRVYVGATGTVAKALEMFNSGSLQEAVQPNVEGHWV
jgi:predicted Fe-Mo cluster-binding NifX family protein